MKNNYSNGSYKSSDFVNRLKYNNNKNLPLFNDITSRITVLEKNNAQ